MNKDGLKKLNFEKYKILQKMEKYKFLKNVCSIQVFENDSTTNKYWFLNT